MVVQQIAEVEPRAAHLGARRGQIALSRRQLELDLRDVVGAGEADLEALLRVVCALLRQGHARLGGAQHLLL